MNKYNDIITRLKVKRHIDFRLKPIEEGYNNGIEDAINVFSRASEWSYQTIQCNLSNLMFNGYTTNRETGYDNAILSAKSMLSSLKRQEATE